MDGCTIFFFGFITGLAAMLIVFTVCLADIKRRVKKLITEDRREQTDKSLRELK